MGPIKHVGTHRGQASFIARFPSGVKLMVTIGDFIPSFIFRYTEQLEAAAEKYHFPANCRTSQGWERHGDLTPMRGTCHPLQKM